MSKDRRTNVESNQHQLSLLGEKLGFAPKQINTLRLALTHSTFFEGNSRGAKNGVAQNDNQRLEFLGDAVLDLAVGEYLYQRYQEAREGELSKMRAFLVCEASLANAAQDLGLPKCLRMGKGAEVGGDRKRPSVQADAYEAMIGAVFISQGYQKAKELILHQFEKRMDNLVPEAYEDKKSLLQEFVQARTPRGVNYRVLAQSGPDHQPLFESGVYCGKILLGKGEGGSKKESELVAASQALETKDIWLDKIL